MEVSVEGDLEEVVPLTKSKLTRMQAHLFKLMRLVSNEPRWYLYMPLTKILLEVYILLESAEKGETNVGRNASYPE